MEQIMPRGLNHNIDGANTIKYFVVKSSQIQAFVVMSSQEGCLMRQMERIQSNEIDGANYEMDGVKHKIDGVNHKNLYLGNHVKQSSTLQSTLATHSLFQSSTLIQSSLVMKELLGWSLDGALDPWSSFYIYKKEVQNFG